MHTAIRSFADVINRWKTAEELGGDINEKGGTVRAWRARDTLPPETWNRVIAAAARRGFSDITHELLATLAERKARPAPTEPPEAAA